MMNNDMYSLACELNNMFYEDGAKSFPVDITEEGGAYTVYAEMPGLKKENITVSFDEGTLTISAKNEKTEKKNYLIRERNSLKYERSIYFGDINEDTFQASYNDGVLKVVIKTKAPEAKAKKMITIE